MTKKAAPVADTVPAAAPKRPPARADKGEPPTSHKETTAVTNYTKKAGRSDKKTLAVEMTAEAHTDLKIWSAQHGFGMAEALLKGLELLKEKHR